MNKSKLYKPVNVCRRVKDGEIVVYRCFELLPSGGFVVQSADRIREPVNLDDLRQHERQLWELFCDVAPEDRGEIYPTLEDAIAAFDADFKG